MSLSPAEQLAQDGFYLAKSGIPEAHLNTIENEVKQLSKSFGVEGDDYASIWNNAVSVSRETKAWEDFAAERQLSYVIEKFPGTLNPNGFLVKR